jgi:hypothetical protein
MTPEDEEFARIEAEIKRRQNDDDDIQEYAHQRQWVGLTDEERFEICMHSVQNMGENFQETLCKAIEAKLKEKNQ